MLKDYEEEQKLLQEQLNSNNNNNSKEDDSTTSVSELESAADTNSIAGDKLLDLGSKSKSGDQDIMEVISEWLNEGESARVE